MAGLLLLLFLAAWAFHPGIGGGFIFDDEPNLHPWADLGDINSFHKLLTFIFSSKFFPGRPLSMLSFLVDDQSWPADIVALKRTNLAIHLINVCLVYWLALQLMRRMVQESEPVIAMLALFVAATWALHPIQVSNVSYVIQRMNLLETTLVLAALLLFMAGRDRLTDSPRNALLICSAAIGTFMPLAILAKENGLLLCAFALLIEGFCYTDKGSRIWRIWKGIFLWAPLAAFVFYCLVTYHGFTTGFETRDFDARERLLTEGPVLVDYLHKLLLPRLHGSGLYFDNFPVSHSLMEPVTLASWLLIAGLLATAVHLRRRLPLVSFGILFYFCGHLMESTLLPLELYFEHRNYLPQAGLWLAAAGLLAIPASRRLRIAQAVLAILWVAALTAMTRDNAALWSRPLLQATIWYQDNPSSQRSILTYANALISEHDSARALQVLALGERMHPDNLGITLSRRVVSCYGENLPTRFDDLAGLARHAPYDTSAIIMLERMRRLPPASGAINGCRRPDNAEVAAIYLSLLQNPQFRASGTTLLSYLGEISLAADDPVSAAGYYIAAFRRSANPIDGYHAASILAHLGQPDRAREYALAARQRVGWRDRIQHPDLMPLLDKVIHSTANARGGA